MQKHNIYNTIAYNKYQNAILYSENVYEYITIWQPKLHIHMSLIMPH